MKRNGDKWSTRRRAQNTGYKRMLKELSGCFNSIKVIQPEMKETLNEIRNNGQRINRGMDETENHINDLEHKEEKDIQSVQQVGKRIQKIEVSVRSPWDNCKHSNICIIGVPEREGKEQKIRNLSEKIMKENFPNLVKKIDIQVQETQRAPNRIDIRGSYEDTS